MQVRNSNDASQLSFLTGIIAACLPMLTQAQTSPFLTGATALQTNILTWLTPIAVILIMVLGAMAMANRIAQVSSTYGSGAAQTIVENCGNTLILRCAGSEHGGTSQFASRLIGQREVVHTTISRSQRLGQSLQTISQSESRIVEPAVMASEIERLPDLSGYLRLASIPDWMRVTLAHEYSAVAASEPGGSARGLSRHEVNASADLRRSVEAQRDDLGLG